jgi:uncharacterized SAM-dependent methyltransferase
MLPYAYLGAGNCYEHLLQEEPNYYPFRDEAELIATHRTALQHYLQGFTDVVELGPGSHHAILNKTFPFLRSASSATHYYGVDLSEDYLAESKNLIRQSFPKLKVRSIEADFLEEDFLCRLPKKQSRKAIIFFGHTWGNFSPAQQRNFLSYIGAQCSVGDCLFLTFDTNCDKISLEKAYGNRHIAYLLGGILDYYTTINPSFAPYQHYFEYKCEWNSLRKRVEMFFESNFDFSFCFSDYKTLQIPRGKRFLGAWAHKFDVQQVHKMVELKGSFKVHDILQYQTTGMIVCEKIS